LEKLFAIGCDKGIPECIFTGYGMFMSWAFGVNRGFKMFQMTVPFVNNPALSNLPLENPGDE